MINKLIESEQEVYIHHLVGNKLSISYGKIVDYDSELRLIKVVNETEKVIIPISLINKIGL